MEEVQNDYVIDMGSNKSNENLIQNENQIEISDNNLHLLIFLENTNRKSIAQLRNGQLVEILKNFYKDLNPKLIVVGHQEIQTHLIIYQQLIFQLNIWASLRTNSIKSKVINGIGKKNIQQMNDDKQTYHQQILQNYEKSNEQIIQDQNLQLQKNDLEVQKAKKLIEK
ncbi:UNKNOWN [Stylonychia lemnae]|uniref:Uncharacterized protein n=1 Tax=Stylonychia lemnae TaxID=5949 RepID=A0A078B1F8_STYLE|nr:UNKNOWN [Stylonychia lemnae]|eukprot:CDW88395.1 UNKNOWN [Stylonychia lemnae]